MNVCFCDLLNPPRTNRYADRGDTERTKHDNEDDVEEDADAANVNGFCGGCGGGGGEDEAVLSLISAAMRATRRRCSWPGASADGKTRYRRVPSSTMSPMILPSSQVIAPAALPLALAVAGPAVDDWN